MCLGHTHAISGAVVGAAIGEFPLHLGPAGIVTLAGFTAAFATLPDLDTRHSCAARSLGFFSAGFAFLVGKVSGGHRHGTHSILGVAVFTGYVALVALFGAHPWDSLWWADAALVLLAGFLALALAAGLRAFRVHGHVADIAALGAACAVAVTGWHMILIPLACGLGCLVHVFGDMLTVEGCPLAWPWTLRHYRLLPSPLAFVTGTWRETWVVSPALLLALGWLAYLDIPH
jgi:membrane-bound metal-dependent hydrolase YbcI (DUF457 family)